ncbi:hypothetical protein D8674_039127 [Pyrus ussuriensis x Pyrus communis]|uniref:Uncharacterized protein n=1 Tax=Pyrus ussuriensis x Pyrus communis TaxID=2448454 RepID=A0A5N5I1N4_9ROSA|nr:hypothetical protein D8674_039127 [Pyrus ussuriensis x Pyrus communis]
MSGLAAMGYRVLASGRSNEAFRKRWSSNFGAVVCSVGSPFVLRMLSVGLWYGFPFIFRKRCFLFSGTACRAHT